MRHISILIMLFGLFFSLGAYAGGGITHMFIAEESISQLSDSRLRNVIQDNLDAYLVGAHYPDSGFVPGTGYGEDSHWDKFIYTFAEYLNEKYKNPLLENPKLVAFLMGCATHRMSDEIIHFVFYPDMAAHDFHDNYDKKAHKYGDVGIDLLLNIDKARWHHQPKVWWVPVNDLVTVYQRMGKDEYTAEKITYGNSVLSIAGPLERLIAIPSYPYLRLRMPWTAKNYFDWPQGGMRMDIKEVAGYQNDLWHRLNDTKIFSTTTRPIKYDHESSIIALAKQILDNNVAKVAVKKNVDGSVELQPLLILDENKFIEYTRKGILD